MLSFISLRFVSQSPRVSSTAIRTLSSLALSYFLFIKELSFSFNSFLYSSFQVTHMSCVKCCLSFTILELCSLITNNKLCRVTREFLRFVRSVRCYRDAVSLTLQIRVIVQKYCARPSIRPSTRSCTQTPRALDWLDKN